MKNKKLTKSTKIFFLVGGLVLSGTAATTATVLLMNKKITIKYLFENNTFSNKDQIFDYAYANAKNTNYNFENLKYLIDDKVFNSESEFNQFINKNYPIKSVSTIKNPNDYLINNSGELSSLVLTGETEKGIDVYKGINGNAFFSKETALNTYLNSFEEKYSIDGSTFDSLYNAQNYYRQVVLDRLENEENKPIKVYTNGGIQYSEQELKSRLKSSLKRGFEYNGQSFSDYNYSEFLETMKGLDHYIIDDNIKPVMNADKSSYWIDYKTSNFTGYFVGPKYLESNEKIPSNVEFKVIDSQDVNVLLSKQLSIVVLGGLISSAVNDLLISNKKEFNFIDYLENSFAKYNLNLTVLKNFVGFYENFPPSIQDDAAISLGNITDLEFTDFDKVLVVMKRLLTAAKVYDLKDISGKTYKEFEKLVKQVIVELLTVQKGLMKTLFGSEKETIWSDTFLSDDVSFDDIYNLFLNSWAFYNDGGNKGLMFSALQKAYGVLDNIISTVLSVAKDFDKLMNNFDKLKNTKDKSQEVFNEESKASFSAASDSFMKNKDSLNQELNIEINEENPDTFALSPLSIVSAVWSLGKMFSFITFITAEAKIDSYNSIYYFEPTFKIPFLNTMPFKSEINANVIELNESPLKMMLPQDEEGNNIPVYEFNNQYYLDREVAKTALIDAIYLHPEQYLPSKQLMTSSFGDNWELNLPPICQKDCEENHEHITWNIYQEKLNEEKEKFVQFLFDNYYEETSGVYYSNGFGEFFSTSNEAIVSLQEKVDDVKNYKKIYSYKIGNDTIYKDTEAEIIQFIKDNQLIQEKKVINTDLIETMIFDKINTYYDQTYQVYKLAFYGEEKYFRSKLESENFLYNHLSWRILSYYDTINTYEYDDAYFMNQREFDVWIEQRITEIK